MILEKLCHMLGFEPSDIIGSVQNYQISWVIDVTEEFVVALLAYLILGQEYFTGEFSWYLSSKG